MKKALLGGVVVLVIGYGGTTYYFGGEAEKQFKTSIQMVDTALQKQMQDVPGPKFKFLVQNYDKGFFSSTASLKVSVDISQMPQLRKVAMKEFSYQLPLKIENGPFIASIAKPGLAYATSTLQVPDNIAQMAKTQLSPDSKLPELNMSLLINFDNSARFDGSVPAFTLAPNKFPGKFSWKGMDIYYDVSKDMDRINGETTLNGFELDSPFANGSVSKISMVYDMKASEYGGLWTGTGQLTVPAIDISMRGKKFFDLDDLKFDSSANISQGLLALNMSSSMKKATIKNKTYGPLSAKFYAKNIDAQVFSEVQHLLQQVNQSRYLSRKQRNALMDKLDTKVPALVSKGMEVGLSQFNLQLPQGLIKASFSANVPSSSKVASIMDLANVVVAKGQLQMPKSLLENILVTQAKRKIRHQQMMQQLQGSQATNQEPPQDGADVGDGNSTSSNNDAGSQQQTAQPPKMLSQVEIQSLAKEKVDKQLQKLIDNQMISEQADSYMVNLSYDKGHMMVNGKPMTPDMFQQ